MVGSISLSNAGFGAINTAQRSNTNFGIQQGLEAQYAGMSTIATTAMNNPKALENPQVMAKLQEADKKAMLKLEQDKISAAVYAKLEAEQKRIKAQKKADSHNSTTLLV
jgi:hypothetical protein